ncbi:ABC transporter ATP-binding protein [Streptomyces sp. NPDC048442]|uniref:ABC transporter ATP-binding protein n=1 Tax=Streptomyces sp. NPDC048442 TaxID=3154823 RepID=UPI00342482AB
MKSRSPSPSPSLAASRPDSRPASLPAVVLEGLGVRYGDTVAVDAMSFGIEAGRISALLGPNGAGKSSVIKAICTLLRPSAGRARVFGHDTQDAPMAVRGELGVVFQEPTLDQDLSVERNLRFHARLFGLRRAAADTRIEELLESFGLTDRRNSKVEDLSGGLARRVEIARALVHRPRLLVLDEPTVGLDPESRRAVWNDLRALRSSSGLTVLYSTHYMDEVEYADQVVIVRDGGVVREGTPSALKSGLGLSGLLLLTHDDAAAELALGRAGFTVSAAPPGEGGEPGGLFVRSTAPEEDVSAVLGAVGAAIRSVSVRHPTMDDVFLEAAVHHSHESGGSRAGAVQEAGV